MCQCSRFSDFQVDIVNNFLKLFAEPKMWIESEKSMLFLMEYKYIACHGSFNYACAVLVHKRPNIDDMHAD